LGQSTKVRVKIPKYSIPKKKVTPTLLDINDLLPHEEIIHERLNALLKMILELGAVDMPIIAAPIPGVSKYLIVDGHHRWAALKRLGARKVPAIIINYFSPEVQVYTWYPGFKGDAKEFLDMVNDVGVKIEINRNGESIIRSIKLGKCRVDNLECAFVMIGKDSEYFKLGGWLEGQKRIVKVLDELAGMGKLTMTWYGLLEDALKDLKENEIDYVLVRRGLTKDEVMKVVKAGKVLPPKTTRHVLPFIPEKVYTRLSMLM